MDDLATAPLSTVLDGDPSPSPTGGGVMSLTEPEPKSLREDIEAAFREEKAPEKVEARTDAKDDEKAEQKPAKEINPEEPKEEVKDAAKAGPAKADAKDAAPADAEKVETAAETKPEEKPDGTYRAPPKSFLPDSHETWRNVPRPVRRDIEAMVQTHQAETERFQEVSQRYDRIRDFDELATSNGRDLRESLTQVHQFENLMRQNPVAALNMALMQVGPRKPDGQPFSLFEIAQHIAQQGPEGYQRMVAQPQQGQQQQEDPRVGQLEQQLQEMKVQQLAAQVIDPFKAKHPRYDELAEDIALFLQSGRIPTTLSHHDRLAAAYDMAERVNPASRVPQPATNDDGPEQARRADLDLSGSKSIRPSLGSVTEDVEDAAPAKESIRDSILKAGRGLKRS